MFSNFKIVIFSILFVSMANVAKAELIYLNDTNITVSLGSSMSAEPFQNQTTAISLANIIDAPSADAGENHTSPTTHVWVSGGPLELNFDFGIEYDLTAVHFWNYLGESFDVDNIDFIFFDSAKVLVGSLLNVEPVLGGGGSNPIFSEDYALAFPSNTRFVNVTLTGSNGQVDFNNIGFTGNLSIPSVPDVTITPLSHAFGDVTVGNTSNKTFTVTNDGNASLFVDVIGLVDTLSVPFSLVSGEDNCSGQNLAPAANCTFDIRFEPTSAVTSNDSFDISSNDPDENLVIVNLDGTGVSVSVPDIDVTPMSQVFGDVTIGNALDKRFTLSNDGNASLSVNMIALVDTLAAPFSLVLGEDNCSGQNLAPAANCTFDVRFEPTSVVTSNDSFDISSNDPDESLVTVNLSGTGLSAAVNQPPSAPELVFPANGATVTESDVTFGWNRSNDPDGDAITYTLSICEDEALSEGCTIENVASAQKSNSTSYVGLSLSLVFGFVVIGCSKKRRKLEIFMMILVVSGFLVGGCGNSGGGGGSPVAPVADITRTVSGLTAGKTYHWQVVANDGNGGETPSETWSFTSQ